jgi:Tfp pilus assembly protein PilE
MELKPPENKAFTMVQLIIVISIITAISVVIYGVIDQKRRVHEARNASRLSTVTNLANTLKKFQVDYYTNPSDFPPEDDPSKNRNSLYYMIGTCTKKATGTCKAASVSDSCLDVTKWGAGQYVTSLPIDPLVGTTELTQYYYRQPGDGSIIVGACNPEGEGANGAGRVPKIELRR